MTIIEFPKIKSGKEGEFKQWFTESNKAYAKFDGFISRRLLLSENGKYATIVEHKSKDTFMKMHKSQERNDAFAKLRPLLEGVQIPHLYEVIEV